MPIRWWFSTISHHRKSSTIRKRLGERMLAEALDAHGTINRIAGQS
jgi:hypothetical protein